MKRKSNFEKKYPLLVDHITDEVTRQNMLENSDLLRKYELFANLISTFIAELNKRFDKDTILFLITEVVLKLPDTLLESVIVAYLNSPESVKSNAEFLTFYNKTLHLGEDCVHYIEKHGIICSRKYLTIPSIIIDDEYNRIKSGQEIFREESLDNIFSGLSFESKKYVVSLIRLSGFSILDLLFRSSSIALSPLLNALHSSHIPADLFTNEILNKLGVDDLRLLVYMLLDMNYVDLSIIHIKNLIVTNRIDLLKKLIASRKIYFIYELTFDEIGSLSDEEILDKLNKEDINLLKKDE